MAKNRDQIYLRLVRELPQFRRPTAVVAIFMTELFGRNLDEDRPHLGPGSCGCRRNANRA